jgi:hypothetical protein
MASAVACAAEQFRIPAAEPQVLTLMDAHPAIFASRNCPTALSELTGE